MTVTYSIPHKFDQLGSIGRRLTRIPRYGRLIARLSDRHTELQTEAETFWQVYTHVAVNSGDETGVLDAGLRADAARNLGETSGCDAPRGLDFRDFQIRRACDILGAVAYEMYLWGDSPQSAVKDTQHLSQKVIDRLSEAKVEDFYGDPVRKQDLHSHLNSVFAMDAAELKYFIFTTSHREIRWTENTQPRNVD